MLSLQRMLSVSEISSGPSCFHFQINCAFVKVLHCPCFTSLELGFSVSPLNGPDNPTCNDKTVIIIIIIIIIRQMRLHKKSIGVGWGWKSPNFTGYKQK